MARNRYAKDYRLVETIDERGRIKTDYEYIGAPYRFEGEEAAVARDKKLAIALCPLLWLLFLASMLPNSNAMRCMLVTLPFVFTALPLGFLTDIVLSVCFAREPLEHRHADKVNNSLPPSALAAAVLSAAAVLAQLVRALKGGEMNGGDWLFLLGAAALSAACFYAFSFRKKLAVGEA